MLHNKMKFFIVAFAAINTLALGQPIETEVGSNSDWRIVGGFEAAEGQFPYQISLLSHGSHNCGGSIINSRWVLTAAHCVFGFSPFSLTVVAGTNSLSSGGTRHSVSRFIIHELYNSLLAQNDVALVRLSEEITLGSRVQSLQLESREVGIVNCTVSGWGRVSYPGELPDTLQYIQLKTMSPDDCQSQWDNRPVIESQVCTLTRAGEGVCYGDSGGPLVADGKQIGIVSWGNPCAVGSPDVYTRVSSFYDWIQSTTTNS